jgi:predicted RNA-binding Zn-ribbon protein involved in translation (DUF1610 family)
MKCPNCKVELSHDEKALALEMKSVEVLGDAGWETRIQMTLRDEPFPCPNCPVMIKTNDRFKELNQLRRLPVLFAILLAPFLLLGVPVTVSVVTSGQFPESALLLGLTFLGIFWILVGVSVPISAHASRCLRHVSRLEVAWVRRTCQQCGTVIPIEDAEFCPICGVSLPLPVIGSRISGDMSETEGEVHKLSGVEPVGTCLVCDLEMNRDDVLAVCPRCCNAFHKAHLVAWVHLKKSCPACGERLVESEIMELSLHP